MTSKKTSFLHAVVGNDGAKALIKATSQDEELNWAVVPGAIMSWLEVVSLTEYNDSLPGVSDTKLSFSKSEQSYNGCINIGKEIYNFKDVSLFHVAGSIAVALGSDSKAPDLSNPSLSKLAKSVNLLVKSRTLRKMQGKIKPPESHGPAAPALAPLPAMENRETAPKTVKKPSKSKPKEMSLEKKSKKTIKISKSESKTPCSTCGQLQFSNDKYVACMCFKSLSKNVKTTAVDSGYILEFIGLAGDEIMTIAEALGK